MVPDMWGDSYLVDIHNREDGFVQKFCFAENEKGNKHEKRVISNKSLRVF